MKAHLEHDLAENIQAVAQNFAQIWSRLFHTTFVFPTAGAQEGNCQDLALTRGPFPYVHCFVACSTQSFKYKLHHLK